MPRLSRSAPGPGRVVAEGVLGAVGLGALAGVGWSALSPTVTAQVVDAPGGGLAGAVSTPGSVGLFAAQAWFLLVTAAAGALLTVLLVVRHRHAPVATLAGGVLGGAAGSLTAWWLGVLLGPDDVDLVAAGLRAGDTVPVPLALDAYAVLFAWPVMAATVVAVTAAVRVDETPWELPSRLAAPRTGAPGTLRAGAVHPDGSAAVDPGHRGDPGVEDPDQIGR